jgi:TolB-like protein/DNA-binding winged helix-turn-helix (wHTH) protein/Tfp pilus assembly protein PilF
VASQRSHSSDNTELRVGQWHVRPALNQIRNERTVQHLEPQLINLLVFLASNDGQVVSKDQIIAKVWEGRFIADATLTRSIADLRRALGDNKERPQYIETIAKRGYRLIAPVAGLSCDDLISRDWGRDIPARRPLEPSLVVLPFTNFGPETDRYFCEGLTEEIINALTRLPGLRVISRTSAFAAHGHGGDIADIGRRLDVTHAIEGSIRRAGRHIRVTAQLVRTSDHGHVWSERYDRHVEDVFAVQDDIADAIARRLELTLPRLIRRSLAPTRNPAAYDRFIEGRHHFLRGTSDSFENARRCFSDAVKLDADFALAHDALSEIYWYMGFYGLMVPKDAFASAVWESLRALEIDDHRAESHALLAMLRKELDYDWSEVQREFARALELNPHSPVVRMRYALCGLMPHGRLAEAAAELRSVVESDPLSIPVRWWLGSMYLFSRQPGPMREQVDRMLEIDPVHPLAHMGLGTLQLLEGHAPAAATALERACVLAGRPMWLLGWLGLTYGAAGQRENARAIFEELVALESNSYVSPFSLALVAYGLGNIDETFDLMNRAIDVRDPLVVPLLSYPFFDDIRSDRRYSSLLSRLNLAC